MTLQSRRRLGRVRCALIGFVLAFAIAGWWRLLPLLVSRQ